MVKNGREHGKFIKGAGQGWGLKGQRAEKTGPPLLCLNIHKSQEYVSLLIGPYKNNGSVLHVAINTECPSP